LEKGEEVWVKTIGSQYSAVAFVRNAYILDIAWLPI